MGSFYKFFHSNLLAFLCLPLAHLTKSVWFGFYLKKFFLLHNLSIEGAFLLKDDDVTSGTRIKVPLAWFWVFQ